MPSKNDEYRPPRFTEYLRSLAEITGEKLGTPLPERTSVNLAECRKARMHIE